MIVLSEYGLALFLAKAECMHKDRKDYKELSKIDFKTETRTINEKEIKCDVVIPNPNYSPYKDGELERIDKEENRDIYNYLKENYPGENYSEIFKKNEMEDCHGKGEKI